MSHDTEIADFVSMTGATADVASDILAQCRWKLSAALDLFFGSHVARSPSPRHPPKKPVKPPRSKSVAPPTPGLPATPFQEIRDFARSCDQLLLVCITRRPLPVPILSRPPLKNFIAFRFVPFEVSLAEPDGQRIAHVFDVSEFPCFLVLHPTKDLIGKTSNEATVVPYLQQLLAEAAPPRPEFAFDLRDDDSGDDHRPPDDGSMRVLVQLASRKIVDVRVGARAEVRALYAKVAALLGQRSESFVLELPAQRLTDRGARVGLLLTEGCVVRVADR